MPKISTIFYTVSVDGPQGKAATFVVRAYNLGAQHRAAEFHMVYSAFDDSGFSIPADRQATFTQELRVTGKASALLVDGDDEKSIESAIREAYPGKMTITIEPVSIASRQ